MFEAFFSASFQLRMLRFFTKMTAVRSSKKLALSFNDMEPDRVEQVVVVPPLIRQEVTAIQPEEGNYIHGYMVNSGFADSVEEFHTIYPEVPLRFFWDKADADEVTRIDETLSFYQIDDVKFLNGMAGCRAYATTAGFESICEAMYLGKPVLMVPAHIEQDCNAHDAMRAGAGIISDSFDLKPLLRFAGTYSPNRTFVRWVRSGERRIILELEKLAAPQSAITSIPTFNKTDYVLERASDGGYYAWLTVNMQCNAYGESPEEAVLNLQETMNEMIDEMYMVEEFI